MKLIRKIEDKLRNLDSNNRIVLKNTVAAFVVKGGSLVISLFTTPAFISYFNNNAILGVWYTLLSVLIWFLNFDFGIGNGIRNNLVKALAENDRKSAKQIISSGFFSTSLVTLVLCIIGVSLFSLLDLNAVFNIEPTTISGNTLFTSSMLVFFAIMLRFLLTNVTSVFYAMQKSAVNNFLSFCVSLLQLIFVLVFHFDDPEEALIVLSFAYLFISNLPTTIGGIMVFCTEMKDCRPNIRFIDKKSAFSVLKIGGIFFACQILYMIIANTNEFLITNFFGPQYTTEYSFYYKLCSLGSMAVTLALTPIWSMVTKAATEKDYLWINKLFDKIKFAGLLIVALQFLMIPFLQTIMNLWLRDKTISVDFYIALAFACFGSVFVYSGMLSTIVCGLAKMRLQTICYSVGVIVKITFVIVMSKLTDDWSVVVWSNVLILMPYCILQHIELNKLLSGKVRACQ